MSSSTGYKVVLDTNVFISGLIFGGNCEKILRLVKEDRLTLLISPRTHNEVLSKLPKFGLDNDYISRQDAQIRTKATKALPKIKLDICRDPKDNMFLELCLAGRADYLITGDKDLLALKTFQSSRILTPKKFLDHYSLAI